VVAFEFVDPFVTDSEELIITDVVFSLDAGIVSTDVVFSLDAGIVSTEVVFSIDFGTTSPDVRGFSLVFWALPGKGEVISKFSIDDEFVSFVS
jgi:hypothetical protein